GEPRDRSSSLHPSEYGSPGVLARSVYRPAAGDSPALPGRPLGRAGLRPQRLPPGRGPDFAGLQPLGATLPGTNAEPPPRYPSASGRRPDHLPWPPAPPVPAGQPSVQSGRAGPAPPPPPDAPRFPWRPVSRPGPWRSPAQGG